MKKIIIFTSSPSSNHSIKMLLHSENDDITLWSGDAPSITDNRIIHNWSNSFFGLIKLGFFVFKSNFTNSSLNLHHEFNVYNGKLGLIFVPFYFFINRNLILTLHAYIPQKSISNDFLKRFNINISLFLAKFIFKYFYFLLFYFSKKIILHSFEQLSDAKEDFPQFTYKMCAIPAGVDFAVTEIEMRKSYPLTKEFDFLSFGYISPRKGLENILNALLILKERNIQFSYLICGFIQEKNYNYSKNISDFILKNDLNVTIIPGVEDQYIDSIFSQCRCTLFLYEDLLGLSGPYNFALANNSFVLCRQKGTFSEMTPANSIFVKDLNPNTIANAMELFLNSTKIPKNHPQNIAYPNWSDYVKNTFKYL